MNVAKVAIRVLVALSVPVLGIAGPPNGGSVS
jgi:hypothetical protein